MVSRLVGATGAAVAARIALQRLRAIDLEDRLVLITGASRGLGLALGEELTRHGARLAICARDAEELERAAERLRARGAEVLAVPCDVAETDQVSAMVRRVREEAGEVDLLVNNAGIITVGPIQTQTLDDFREAMGVMYWGMVHPTLAVLPSMIGRGEGRIVNITSIGGKISFPHLLPYNAAKFAAVGFSQGLRAEVARYGVKVITVVPGFMRTGSYVNAMFKGKHRAEYTWFSIGDALPLTSTSAARAARLIVEAARRGESEPILTPPAKLATRFHGLFPGLTADILAIVNRLLPGPGGVGQERKAGRESGSIVSPSWLTTLGDRAAREYEQLDGGSRR